MTDFKDGDRVVYTNPDSSLMSLREISGKPGVVITGDWVEVQGFTRVQYPYYGTYRLPTRDLTLAPDPSPSEIEGSTPLKTISNDETIAAKLHRMYTKDSAEADQVRSYIGGLSLLAAQTAYETLEGMQKEARSEADQLGRTREMLASVISDETRWAAIDVADDGSPEEDPDGLPELRCGGLHAHGGHVWQKGPGPGLAQYWCAGVSAR